MNIVIDTNILISAIIKKSTTRKIILDSNLGFYYPFPSFHELDKHKNLILRKSKLGEENYNIILLSLLRKIKIVPFQIIKSYIPRASKIMFKIHPDDTIFIATALASNCPIWSDDNHFKKQNKIKTLTTSDMVALLK